jgi:hypothetical protein
VGKYCNKERIYYLPDQFNSKLVTAVEFHEEFDSP